MKKLAVFLFFSCCFFISGCMSMQPEFTATTPKIQMTTVVSKQYQVSPTPPKENDTTTPIIHPTEKENSVSSQIQLHQDCFSIQTGLPKNHSYQGWLVFETNDIRPNSSISLFNINSLVTKEISYRGLYVAISPDRENFAYLDLRKNSLEIMSANGGEIKSIAWEKSWRGISGWLDDQRLMLLSGDDDMYPHEMTVLNWITMQKHVIKSDYPDIDHSAGNNLDWLLWGITAYDPTLSRVVYLSPMTLGSEHGMGYTLYDISKKEILAKFIVLRYNQRPLWFEDGSKFIVMGDSEFIQVTADGKVTIISHLNPNYSRYDETGRNYTSDRYYSWSPDGRHLAFWLVRLFTEENGETLQPTLAILDVTTGVVTDTCVVGGYDPDYRIDPRYPIWSPDGKAILIAANYDKEKKSNEVIALDIEKKIGYQLMKNQFPAGWMVSNQK